MSVLTPLNLEFEHANIMERIRSISRNAHDLHSCSETGSLLLELIIRPLIQHADFGVFRPLMTRAHSLLSSGHLRNARELEVMLLAHRYVSAPLVGGQFLITLTEHRDIVSHRISVQSISGKSHRWSILTCCVLHSLGGI